jgi:hypothetical protein
LSSNRKIENLNIFNTFHLANLILDHVMQDLCMK